MTSIRNNPAMVASPATAPSDDGLATTLVVGCYALASGANLQIKVYWRTRACKKDMGCVQVRSMIPGQAFLHATGRSAE